MTSLCNCQFWNILVTNSLAWPAVPCICWVRFSRTVQFRIVKACNSISCNVTHLQFRTWKPACCLWWLPCKWDNVWGWGHSPYRPPDVHRVRRPLTRLCPYRLYTSFLPSGVVAVPLRWVKHLKSTNTNQESTTPFNGTLLTLIIPCFV